MAKELAQHISLACVFEVLLPCGDGDFSSWIPEDSCPGRVPDLRAKPIDGTIAVHLVARSGTYEVAPRLGRYATRV